MEVIPARGLEEGVLSVKVELKVRKRKVMLNLSFNNSQPSY